MFRGKFDHTLDDKGRLSLPVKFREILRKYDDNIIITTFDSCLYVYPYEEWIIVEEDLYKRPGAKEKCVIYSDLFFPMQQNAQLTSRDVSSFRRVCAPGQR